VQTVDGHDIGAVSDALAAARQDPRPSLIACRTTIGRGIPGVEGTRAAHSAPITPAQSRAARAALDWPHAPFDIPEPIRRAWTEAGRRALGAYDAWHARVAALPPERRALLDRLREGRLPAGWRDRLHALRRAALANPAPEFGIKLSADIVEQLADVIPELVSGAPDLEAPTQHKRRLAPFTADNHAGRYVHYGIREHAMGAMLNGMAAHGGVLPVGATYLVFSDYLRPTLRMAAMMGLPVPFVFSHDSIGIGRNGPTHQPVEFLASLRCIPNLLVLRPADAVEAAECWEIALEHRTGPCALIFARQQLPPVRSGGADENLSRRGAYILAEPDDPRRATLLATGSEVSLALAARDLLASAGIAVAVVSMPCWELFEQQPASYRDTVLGAVPRVAVEAAVRQGWDRYIGPDGRFVGMSGFGASGPADELYRHFGITPERVAEEVCDLLAPGRAG
jgi:transketolase